LDVLQCEHRKVTPESHNIIFFLQGNRFLPASLLLKGAWLLAEMIARFCGGTVEIEAVWPRFTENELVNLLMKYPREGRENAAYRSAIDDLLARESLTELLDLS
jgi:hypothetical protein